MPFSINKLAALEDEWRNPRRIIPINPPRKLDERGPVASRFYARDFDLCHERTTQVQRLGVNQLRNEDVADDVKRFVQILAGVICRHTCAETDFILRDGGVIDRGDK